MNAEGLAGFFQAALAGGRLSHACLFLGSDGAVSLADNLAGVLLCRAPESGRPCGRCTDCRQLAAGFHPDLTVVVPAPNSIKIEQVRELQKVAGLAPYQAQRKVFVLKEAQKMTGEAANCLLKSLEEPTDDVFFILVADSGEELLPTVVSRCQKFCVTGPADARVDSGAADQLGAFLAAWQSRDVSSLLKLGEGLAEDKKLTGLFLDRLAVFYRDQAVRCETGDTAWPAGDGEESGPARENTGWRAADLVRCFDRVESARRHLAANANTRLLLDSLFLYLAGEA